MASLVLEGGTMRAIFTSGVLDAFLEHNVYFPYVIGVSGGINHGISYISRQKGRNIEIIHKLKDYKKPTINNVLNNNSVYNMKFVFETIPHKIAPLDYKAFYSYPGKVLAAATNVDTGKAEYLDVLAGSINNEVIKATCCVPGLFKPQEIDGKFYFDGGVSDSIPILKAIKDGNEKHVIILTRPKGYIKKYDLKTKFISKMIEKKYPKVAYKLRERHILYNLQVELCEALEAQGKALIIRPTSNIKSDESNINNLEKTYNQGKKYVYDNIDKLLEFLDY